jgi:hypothetical protein
MAAEVPARERQARARDARIRLVVRLEHDCERRRFEHGSVLVDAAAEKGREITSHVPWGGIDRGSGRGHPLAVGDRLGAVGAQVVAGREM